MKTARPLRTHSRFVLLSVSGAAALVAMACGTAVQELGADGARGGVRGDTGEEDGAPNPDRNAGTDAEAADARDDRGAPKGEGGAHEDAPVDAPTEPSADASLVGSPDAWWDGSLDAAWDGPADASTAGASDASTDAASHDAGAEPTPTRTCGARGRYSIETAGSPTDRVVDRESGRVWQRSLEQDPSLGACDPLRWGRAAYCCNSNGFARCNWQGAMDYCASRGARVPTKAELLSLTAEQVEGCGLRTWVAWSATSETTDRAWMVGDGGGSSQEDIRGPGPVFANVRCVR